MKTIKEGVYGVVLGQAIGDALGSQTEFHSKPCFVKDLGPTWGYPYPAFSDDTQMMLAIAEAIISCGYKPNADLFMMEVGNNFVKWMDGDYRWGANNRSPGGTCMSGVRGFQNRKNRPLTLTAWRESGITNGGKGNGSAMRASVIGAAYRKDSVYAFQLGCISSVITHDNLEANIAAGGVAYLCAEGINGTPFHVAVGNLYELIADWERTVPELAHAKRTSEQNATWALGRISAAYAYANSRMSFEDFHHWNGNDGKGLEALAAAIYYNARSCRYSQIVLDSANWSRDSDTIPAIAGAIAGARWGVGFIPKDWRNRVEKTAYLHDVAERILKFGEGE